MEFNEIERQLIENLRAATRRRLETGAAAFKANQSWK